MKSDKHPLSKPVISIVTVGMNHLKFLDALLKSLYIDSRPSVNFEMIYVDNCSEDQSVSFIKKNYPEVLVFTNKSVKGFAENNNFGVRKSSGEYIAIINPDVVLLDNCIDKLYQYFKSNPNTGILVPKLLNPDHSIQFSVRNFMSAKIFFWRLLTDGNDHASNKIIQEYLLKNRDAEKTQFVDWAVGASFFMSKSFFEELGGFDEDYFLYVEDQDICLRSWKKGRPVTYFPESIMTHNYLKGSARFGKKKWYHFKSLVVFFMKHGFYVRSMKNNSPSLILTVKN